MKSTPDQIQGISELFEVPLVQSLAVAMESMEDDSEKSRKIVGAGKMRIDGVMCQVQVVLEPSENLWVEKEEDAVSIQIDFEPLE